jgi:hypothetical protein
MTTFKQVVALTFLLASTAFAVLPTKTNSNYGGNPSGLSSFCLDQNGTVVGGTPSDVGICAGAPIGEQMFPATSDDTKTIFDYAVHGLDSYTLTLSNSTDLFVYFGLFDAQAAINADPNAGTCKGGDDGTHAYTVFCGPDPNTLSPALTISPSNPTYDVSGNKLEPPLSEVSFTAPAGGNGLVFFVIEENGISPIDGSQSIPPSSPQLKLTAPTPEPGSVILLASVLLVLVGLGRRRLRVSPAVK